MHPCRIPPVQSGSRGRIEAVGNGSDALAAAARLRPSVVVFSRTDLLQAVWGSPFTASATGCAFQSRLLASHVGLVVAVGLIAIFAPNR